MDPNTSYGGGRIKREPDEDEEEGRGMMDIPQRPQGMPQAAAAVQQNAFTAATFVAPAGDSIEVATTPVATMAATPTSGMATTYLPARNTTSIPMPAAATTSAAATAKATPAKKAAATPKKPASAKSTPKTATKATPKSAPKTAAKAASKTTANATPDIHNEDGADVAPDTKTNANTITAPGATPATSSTATSISTGRPRGRPKKNASADDATTTDAAATTPAAANADINTTGNAAISSPIPPPMSSPTIVAPASRPAASRQATTNSPSTRGRGGSRGGRAARAGRAGRGGRGGAALPRAVSPPAPASSTIPTKRSASAASDRSSADGDYAPSTGRVTKQRKVSTTPASAAALRGAKGPGAASKKKPPSVPTPATKVPLGGASSHGGAGLVGAIGGKKGWSVDGQEINRRHKENDLQYVFLAFPYPSHFLPYRYQSWETVE